MQGQVVQKRDERLLDPLGERARAEIALELDDQSGQTGFQPAMFLDAQSDELAIASSMDGERGQGTALFPAEVLGELVLEAAHEPKCVRRRKVELSGQQFFEAGHRLGGESVDAESTDG